MVRFILFMWSISNRIVYNRLDGSQLFLYAIELHQTQQQHLLLFCSNFSYICLIILLCVIINWLYGLSFICMVGGRNGYVSSISMVMFPTSILNLILWFASSSSSL